VGSQARLCGRDGDGEWFELLPQTELQPDTRHRFLIDHDRPITEARLNKLTPEGLRRVQERWSQAVSSSLRRVVVCCVRRGIRR